LVATGGAAVGLLLGGVLTQYVGWRWNFFINVPVGIVMSAAIAKFVPAHSREGVYTGLDLPGATLVTGSLMSMVFGFSQAPSWGWTSLRTLSIFAASIVLLVGFLLNESRTKHPLMPLSIFKIRNVSGANMMMAPLYGVMLGLFFIVTLYVQTILHYSPVKAGLAFLPMPIILGFMSTRIPRLVARYGYQRFLIMGPMLVALGTGWLSLLPVHGSYLTNILPALILIPAGMGMTFMPIIAAATSGVPANEAGLASGLITTSQQMGGAVGLSVLSGVAASVTASSKYLGTAGSLVHGFDRAMLVSLAFIAVAIFVAIFVIHQRRTIKPTDHKAPKAKETLVLVTEV
jgi:MFS family permease